MCQFAPNKFVTALCNGRLCDVVLLTVSYMNMFRILHLGPSGQEKHMKTLGLLLTKGSNKNWTPLTTFLLTHFKLAPKSLEKKILFLLMVPVTHALKLYTFSASRIAIKNSP